MGKILKALAIVILVLGLIGAIVLGNVYGVYGTSLNYLEKSFNWAVFLYGVLVAALAFGLIFAIGEIVDALQKGNTHLAQLNNRVEEMEKQLRRGSGGQMPNVKAQESIPKTYRDQQVYVKPDSATIACPQCGRTNKGNRTVCWECGVHFVNEDK